MCLSCLLLVDWACLSACSCVYCFYCFLSGYVYQSITVSIGSTCLSFLYLLGCLFYVLFNTLPSSLSWCCLTGKSAFIHPFMSLLVAFILLVLSMFNCICLSVCTPVYGLSSYSIYCLLFFYNCIVPSDLSWEVSVPLPSRKPAAKESRYPTCGACWVF